MAQSFKQTKEINYYMCDRTNKMTLSMLVNVLLEVSGKQSAQLDRGEDFVRAKGYNWIILRYDFSIKRMPKANEKVEVETFATEYNKLFTYRNFIVRDENQNKIVEVVATFAIMDLEKRKMTRLPNDIIEPYQAEYAKRIRRNPKPDPVNESNANEKTYNVRYFDIDSNNHVNNSQYITWLLDSLEGDFLSSHTIKKGIVTFDKELKEEDIVRSISSKRTEDGLYTNHQIVVDDIVHCSASFAWESDQES